MRGLAISIHGSMRRRRKGLKIVSGVTATI
jgi:hypothetical protein